MVVLAASIVSRKGKALVSRQFVDMSRLKIEGYLAAFPKLVGIRKQHTYIETETVRYLYQPIEALYLLLITSKNSNILEDLKMLTLLSKLVSQYSASLDEEGISQRAFELIFAFDEVISLGHKENATVGQVKQYCEMYSEEETMHKFVLQNKINVTNDIMKQKASEIDKKKMNKIRGDNKSLPGSGGPESNFSTIFGLVIDDPVSSRSKGSPPALDTAPPKGLGMQLGKTQRTKQFLDLLRAEGEVILEDVPKSSQTKVALPLRESVTSTIEERLNVVTKRDGGVTTFDVRGTLSLQILNQEAAFIQIQIENNETPGLHFLTHPHINKELFDTEHIIGLKDPNRPFPTGQNDVGLLKWRIQDMDEASLPLAVNCWPFVSGNEAFVNIEYKASDKFDLSNVAISVPLPALKDPPSVRQIDGSWRYDQKNCTLEWAISLINDDNRSGSIEFVVPSADSLAFFPITIKFTASSTFSNVKVTGIMPLQGGSAPRFSQKIQLITDNYQVV